MRTSSVTMKLGLGFGGYGAPRMISTASTPNLWRCAIGRCPGAMLPLACERYCHVSRRYRPGTNPIRYFYLGPGPRGGVRPP